MVLTFQKRFIATDSLIKGKLYREKKEIHREDRDYKSLTRGTRLQISTSAYDIRLPNIPTSGGETYPERRFNSSIIRKVSHHRFHCQKRYLRYCQNSLYETFVYAFLI